MTVKELIEQLSKLDPHLEVFHLWDGHLRTQINVVYVSKGGDVVTADYEQPCYDDDERPHGAPTPAIDPYWQTADNPDANA